MKFNFIACFVLTSCIFTFNQNVSAQTKPKTVAKVIPAAKTMVATAQEIEEGKIMISKSDCLACHHPENKLVGPSYTSVSEKYMLNQANVNSLLQKIITGGSGVWGTVPMPPHVALSAADANKMVKYILSLNPKNLSVVAK